MATPSPVLCTSGIPSLFSLFAVEVNESFFLINFQSVIFHQQSHPAYPWFAQCVTFGFFPTHGHEMAYNLFNIVTMYAAPLLVIVVCYALIIWEISKKTKNARIVDDLGTYCHEGTHCKRPGYVLSGRHAL